MPHATTPRAVAPGRRSRPAGPRRTLLAAVACLAALTALPAAPADAYAATAPGAVMPPPERDEDRAGDHLVVTVRDAGGDADGTYEVYCHPHGGSHPDPSGACDVVDENTGWGRDGFAPVPGDAYCSMQYGGPATARVTGTWAGRPVNATYRRTDGCEIARWDRFVPLLPAVGTG